MPSAPSIANSVTVRLVLPARATAVSEMTGVIEAAGGVVTGLDVTASGASQIRIDLTMLTHDPEHADAIVERMREAVFDVFASTEEGDAVIVTHQLPIWMVHRSAAGEPLPHDPRRRRCALSSVTSLARRDGRIAEIAYADSAAGVPAVDEGAS